MIILTHGNDTTASRNFYIDFRQKVQNPIILEGSSLEYSALYQIIEGESLFESDKNVFVENFFSSKKTTSEEVKKVVEYLNSKKDLNLFFWEGKELTKVQANLLKSAEVKQFNYPQLLFAFLDNIKHNNSNLVLMFKNLEKQMETELVLYMIIRQFRLLLASIQNSGIDEAKRMAPWQTGKIEKQARYFGNDELVKAYNDLYKIDYETKFGLSSLPTSARIDIFLANL